MILTGTNYNIRSDNLEHQRLHGSGLYNESRAEHFLNLYNRKPVVSKGGGIFGQTSNRGRGDANKILSLMTKVEPMKKGGSFITPQKKKNTMKDIMKGVKPFVGGSLKPSEQQQEEMTLRVKAERPRKRIQNKTVENTQRAVSGRSTQGINRDRKTEHKQSFAIMKANTKRQMLDNQQPIMKKDGLKRKK
jgi:hypothetical protein